MARPSFNKTICFVVVGMICLILSAGHVGAEYEIAKSSLTTALSGLQGALHVLRGLSSLISDLNIVAALNDCSFNLEYAIEHVNVSLLAYSQPYVQNYDVLTWLSAAMTEQDTCLDGLQGLNHILLTQLKKYSNANIQLLSRSLELAASYNSTASRRRLLSAKSDLDANELPSWLPYNHRRLLQSNTTTALTPNVVVDKNGTGGFRTIQAAVDQVPKNSNTSYVIKINEGVYEEQVIVPKSVKNLVFIGDGIGKTIITGSKSVGKGSTTFMSATLIINGANFFGRDLTVQNTAGAAMHQAVAVRVSADKVTFYKCQFEGFQDTLYTHVLRQFYRECTVYGTVDFVFGNGNVVLQNCTIMARVGNPGQQVTFTAQGRTDPNQNTGLSFHRCQITGTPELNQTIAEHPSYLGRPWKLYSRTLYMYCFLDSIINPSGWLPWDGDFALKTLSYGEYANYGPGSDRSKRVNWSHAMTLSEAQSFAIKPFILQESDVWIPAEVPYQLGL